MIDFVFILQAILKLFMWSCREKIALQICYLGFSKCWFCKKIFFKNLKFWKIVKFFVFKNCEKWNICVRTL